MKTILLSEFSPGWFSLAFPFDRSINAVIKEIPGVRFIEQPRKMWIAPFHAIPALEMVGGQSGLFDVRVTARLKGYDANIAEALLAPAKPYQREAARKLAESYGYILAFDMRLGKTFTATIVAAHALMTRRANTVLVFCPPGVVGEWEKQFPRWSLGLPIHTVEGMKPWNDQERSTLLAAQWLALVCHYDLLKFRHDDIVDILRARGPFMVIGDEAQSLQNVKAARTKAVFSIVEMPNCTGRIALTGTPMRNRPRDLYGPMHFILPGGVGSRTKFTARYADGHMGDYGWEDDGISNEEELAARLKACSVRLTRADVAEFLPKSQRNIILCNMDPQTAQAYAAQEQAQAPLIARALEGDMSGSVQALVDLSRFTATSKIDSIVERVKYHLARGVKVLVGSNFHETAQLIEAALRKASNADPALPIPLFVAGGWKTVAQRTSAIDEWRSHSGPAVLIANFLSSGTGIDLSDAEVCLNAELTWVPADFLQWEARITDIHQGKRKTPPLYEYFLTRNTVDEDMAYKLLKKIANIERIVGGDAESKQLMKTLSSSELVDRSALSLNSVDMDDVRNAIARMRDRLMGKRTATDLDKYERLKAAIDFTELFGDSPDVSGLDASGVEDSGVESAEAVA
jgi:SNF2 family DNA or RNA helicase